MDRMHLRYWYRLNGVDRYAPWFDGGETDGFLTDQEGRIPTFSTKNRLDEWAHSIGVNYAESIVIGNTTTLTDLDRSQAWAAESNRIGLNASNLLSTWNMFTDVAATVSDSGEFEVASKAATGYDALFFACDADRSGSTVPKWSDFQIREVKDVLMLGQALFKRNSCEVS
mgnify:FL=1|tara:strand:- start:6330 stop:6839 length:510 start_codon:yes stop_codon:yes gene_type:complete